MGLIMRRIVLYFFLLGILSTPVQLASAESTQSKINVLSSIKPVQAIVTAIAGEVVKSDLLIPAYISPHDYTFKPSDIRKVQKADLVFRIDEHFETMFNPIFESLPDAMKVISLAESPLIKLLPANGGHEHDFTDHDHADMHIFTSPQNALIMAQEITAALSKADSSNASVYKKNLQFFTEAVRSEIETIKAKLKLVKNKPYIVFHNSWQYFGKYFGLKTPTIIELHEGISTGVKSIMVIRKEIASKDISCIFSEPTISSRSINGLREKLKVKVIEIDVIGRNITMGSASYLQWLEAMGEQINQCLGGRETRGNG